MTLDLQALQHQHAHGARQAFTRLRADHGTETFYAFALYTSDNATGVDIAACSEERYRRLSSRMSGADLANLRWSTAEWGEGYEGGYADCFPDLWAMTEEARRTDFAEVVGCIFAAMVLALRDLDQQGFFGTGPARQQATLCCNVSDSEHAAWLQAESAQRLNPPEVYEVFAKEWLALMAEEIAAARREPSPVYAAFLRAVEGTPELGS